MASFSFRLLPTTWLLLSGFHGYIESLRKEATEKPMLRSFLACTRRGMRSGKKEAPGMVERGVGGYDTSKKTMNGLRSFLPSGHGNKRILTWIICLINTCITLYDKANKLKSLNIE